MKRTKSTKSHPVLGHIDQNSLVLELQDMLNHGSHPEIFEQVVAGLCDHSLIHMADENKSATAKQVVQFLRAWDADIESREHLEWVNDSIESLKRAVKPRAGRSTVERPAAERLPSRCPHCLEVIGCLDVRPAEIFDIGQCPKCGVILGMAPATSRVVEEPTIAPTRETIQ